MNEKQCNIEVIYTYFIIHVPCYGVYYKSLGGKREDNILVPVHYISTFCIWFMFRQLQVIIVIESYMYLGLQVVPLYPLTTTPPPIITEGGWLNRSRPVSDILFMLLSLPSRYVI